MKLSLSSISLSTVAVIGLVNNVLSQNITDDSYFYGQSPPIYPSPNITGTGDWAAAYAKAAALVAQMTLEEKVNLTAGVTSPNGCSGFIPAITRLGFPGLCLSDAGNGVRATDFVSGFPSGVHVGASWNKDLTYNRAHALGGEFYTKGVNVALGPVAGPLGRIALGGRNWEGFANDPYLSGILTGETVRGIQGRGVITSTKHFLGNEQESYRNPVTYSDYVVQSTSSNIDDKTIHELYLWPFADAVRAGTANVMCSYNRLNNSYACSNSKTLNGLLKSELGFQGFVVSDWYALHGGYSTAEAGLDMAMPNGGIYWGSNLTTSVQNGSLPEARLTDMATRTIAAWYKLGQDASDRPAPGAGMPINLLAPHEIVDARDPTAKPVLFDGAVEGHVLVKNTGVLPLKAPKILGIYGYDAKKPDTNDVSSVSFGAWNLGFMSGDVDVIIPAFEGLPQTTPFAQIAQNGTIITGGGSGANTPTYMVAPFDAIQDRAVSDGTAMFWDLVDDNPFVAGNTDVCLVFINAFSSEGVDRGGLHDDFSDNLVNNVADQCNNTIVVIHNAGVRLVDQFADHANVTAIIYAHLPGQDSGTALVSLLYGESTFSGKLPYSVPMNESAYGSLYGPVIGRESPYSLFPQDNFEEGVYIDYRAFDAKNITPRYEFGFGLSYTTFSYSNLSISVVQGANTDTYPSGAILEGGHEDLWDVIYQVYAEVENTGTNTGSEVAQLYVGIPGGPVRQLRGFSKVGIDAGAKVTVEFDLKRRDLSEWDVVAQQWKLQTGTYNVWVGASSRNLPLSGTIII